jgi:F5/8 type C domain
MSASAPLPTEGAPSPAPSAATAPRGLLEWFWRGKAVRQVRAFRKTLPTVEQTRLGHAQRALELADRAFDPVDPLRSGSSLALSISLYREAAYWALAAQDAAVSGTTLAAVLAELPTELLETSAGGPEKLTDLKLALVGRSFVETADLAAELLPRDATLARDFVHALIARKVEPETRVGRLLLQRTVRTFGALAMLSALVISLVLGIQRSRLQPDLATGKPWRASSTYETCKPLEHSCGSARTDIFFHTVDEQEPWVEIDLGAPTSFAVVDVTNRSDCCPDRAVPLVIEVSNDQQKWREVARRTDTFAEWRAKFKPQKARYVRLRSLRRTLLHLEKVAVRAGG